ncbi:MAG: alpha/beta hydrolase [Caulobacterales bacterium]
MEPIDEVRQLLGQLLGGPDASIAHRRDQSKAFAAAAVTPAAVEIRADLLGGVTVEWVVPTRAESWPVFIHLHGGGYVMGDPLGSRPFTTELALRTRSRVVSIDYRLAPEHRFPAAVQDCLMVYRALFERGALPSALAIGGESAGGGLAVAVLLAAKDAGLPMPACAVAMSPWTNLLCDEESYAAKAATDPLLTRAILREMAEDYLGAADPRERWASPSLADLAGLPPMLIQVGSEEVLLGDAQRLAEQARRCGVTAELEVWDRMIHVWHMFHPMLPQGGDAIARVADYLEARWSRPRLIT